MPITVGTPLPALTIYYKLVGNNNNTNPNAYRVHNPWEVAKAWIEDLPNTRPGLVALVTTLDKSVFHVVVATGQADEVLARQLLGDLALAIRPTAVGDRIVAIVADQGHLKEVVWTH
jgi:hypothetical protein